MAGLPSRAGAWSRPSIAPVSSAADRRAMSIATSLERPPHLLLRSIVQGSQVLLPCVADGRVGPFIELSELLVVLLSPVWTREENALSASGGLTVPRPQCYRQKGCGSLRHPRLPRSSRATGDSCSSGPLFTAP